MRSYFAPATLTRPPEPLRERSRGCADAARCAGTIAAMLTGLLLFVLASSAAGAQPSDSGRATPQPVPPGSAQLGFGRSFRDSVYGLHTVDGDMWTLVLNYEGAWKLGESLFFARLFAGDFGGTTSADRSRIYAEWTARLMASKVVPGFRGSGAVRDVFVATQLNRTGTGYTATLIGAGTRLRLPGQGAATSTAYYRALGNGGRGLKWRTSWGVPLRIAGVRLSFEGSEDVATGTPHGTDINGMPQLLFDVSSLVRQPPGGLMLGGELYHHSTSSGFSLVVPQVVLRWAF